MMMGGVGWDVAVSATPTLVTSVGTTVDGAVVDGAVAVSVSSTS